ncbi:hypothetical protein TRM7557_01298 [Tritonibacter multivorans]|uniref:DUF4864 domain-containing protein n=1 Tax=Tritonibacter multivorans TaxID=928856 RepID=A0A0P1GPV0_9RHOB|nr:DUF4864 domain-containing protein [Tritonibacter multivorans]MDA7422818.1 DUF4864 domain-containing protein [Tritonibacter multivorans]CUH77286.1 hypothetical protein TRM7557_01298 [Tritonibacter multivorans]SFD58857.1 protein of unknown function [Tritonibacter multivorans]
MWAWLRISVLALVLAGPVSAQRAPIVDVIDAQIAAFLRDDFNRAFTFASPNIQGLFGSPERFGLMVREGYPMVWRPAEVTYGPLREVAGNLWQRVEVLDQAGRLHLLDYQMVETPEGWKINAVQLLRPPEANV